MENIVPQVEEVNIFGRDQLPWCDATFKATKYKPWLNEDDSKDVLFVSVHGYGARSLMGHGAFYPGSGRTRVPEVGGTGANGVSQAASETAESATAAEGGESGASSSNNQPPALVLDVGMHLIDPTESIPGENRVEWRKTMRDVVLPRVARFKPDLILISAGFDAHKKDCINMGYIGKSPSPWMMHDTMLFH